MPLDGVKLSFVRFNLVNADVRVYSYAEMCMGQYGRVYHDRRHEAAMYDSILQMHILEVV